MTQRGNDDPADSPKATGSLAGLLSRAERAGVGAPPVERWNPDHCGDIDIVIRADGRWLHEGRPIDRPELVRLFSSVLRRDEDGQTYLVTPAERLRISVEDAPFLAVEMDRADNAGEPVLTFRTNVGDVVVAGPGHELSFGEEAGFSPLLRVRGRLHARLSRPVAYDLALLVEADEQGLFLRSGGARFAIPARLVADLD